MTITKQTYQKYKMLIPLLILTGLCASTLATLIRGTVEINGLSYEFMLTEKHYGAFIAVTLSFISFFIFRKYFKYVFGLTLLFGAFCAINFTPSEYSWFLKIGSLKITLQPTVFLVGLLTLALNFRSIKAALDNEGEISEKDILNRQKRFNEEVEKFKHRYKNYPSNDLDQIISDKKYKDSALEAVRQILAERQANSR